MVLQFFHRAGAEAVRLQTDDTPSAGPADVQCFQYDYLGRLVQAWAQGSTGCVSTPSASAEGGASPYWNAYTYNTVGNLTGITATPPAGAATTTTDGYPPAGAARPHAITTSQVTAPSGSTSSSYGYDASGHMATITATAQNEALTWNDAGQLTQTAITPSGGSAHNTNYVYDADGALLLTADPGTTTLYLPDEELSLNTGTGAVTGTRYYSIGGAIVAARTGASTLAYLAGDTQGTDSAAIDSGTLTVDRRYYDPYGNPRGTAPSSFPVGEKGFVGGADDTATGLTDLGAREYQPGTGSFISPDPLLKPYDRQTLNAYAYAADTPSTYSDPTGASPYVPEPGSNGGGCSVQSGCHAGDPKPRGYSPPPGTGNRMVCDGNTCASVPSFREHPDTPKSAPVTRPHTAPTTGSRKLGRDLRNKAKHATDLLLTGGKTIFDLFSGGLSLFSGGLGLLSGGLSLLQGGVDVALGAGISALCGGQSFTANTKVLLASGAALSIADLKPGDEVLATNIKTGKTKAVPVSAVMVHHDTDLYDLKIKAGSRAAVIHTTASHLFWDVTTHRWVKAATLHRGDQLRTPAGSTATVAGGYAPKQDRGQMWDLTVPNDHDFYVDTVAMPVLVHNSDCPINDYSDHARRQMANRGITEQMVDQAVHTGRRTRGNQAGTWKYKGRKIWVVLNNNGRVVSVGRN